MQQEFQAPLARDYFLSMTQHMSGIPGRSPLPYTDGPRVPPIRLGDSLSLGWSDAHSTEYDDTDSFVGNGWPDGDLQCEVCLPEEDIPLGKGKGQGTLAPLLSLKGSSGGKSGVKGSIAKGIKGSSAKGGGKGGRGAATRLPPSVVAEAYKTIPSVFNTAGDNLGQCCLRSLMKPPPGSNALSDCASDKNHPDYRPGYESR